QVTRTAVATSTLAASYNATITDMVGSQIGSGLDLSAFGIHGTAMLQVGEKTTANTTMQLSFSQSVTPTSQTSIHVPGVIDDHHGLTHPVDGSPLPFQPNVNVYMDTIFGGYMYQDNCVLPNGTPAYAPTPTPVGLPVLSGDATSVTATGTVDGTRS